MSRPAVRWALVPAVLAAAFAAATVQRAGASPNMQVGIYDEAQMLYGTSASAVSAFKDLHVQVVRMNLYWGGRNGVANAKPMHPSNPADPAYDWSIYDHIARQVTAAGMNLVFSIYGTPAWANGGKAQNVAPKNPTDLRQFAYAAALRYGGHFRSRGVILPPIHEWIAWNEPNNPVFLTPQYKRAKGHWKMQSAVSYAQICNSIYKGVHNTGFRNEQVACGVTAPRGNNNPRSSRPSVSPVAFLRAVKRYGLKTFDAWADHPYYGRPSETPRTKDGAKGSIEFGNIDKLISLVSKLYGKTKPIWITEYGYETKPPDPYFGVSWAKQAKYLTQAFAIAAKNPRITMMLWFLLKDDANVNGWQSGLITSGGVQKPSYAAFKSMAMNVNTAAGTRKKSHRSK